MKKKICLIICVCMIASICIINIHAKERSVSGDKSNEICSNTCRLTNESLKKAEEESYIINKEYSTDGNLESFDVIVPIPKGKEPTPETRGLISTAIVTIYKTCKIASTMGQGFNPCTYLAMALGRKIINGIINWEPQDRGDWKVTRTSHYGYIPGCEPRHSQSCNGYYYTYSYSKIK